MSKTFYEILGVEKSATENEIKKAYRKLAGIHHPDRNPDNKEAEENFKKINLANETLSNSAKRKKYDLTLIEKDFSFGYRSNAYNVYDYDKFYKNKTYKKPNIIKGKDLKGTITLTYSNLINGYETKIKLKRDNECISCNGLGSIEPILYNKCISCNGNGYIQRSFFTPGMDFLNSFSEHICTICNGTGTTIKNPCSICNGNGSLLSESTINVSIKRGINEPFIILNGEGGFIKNGIRGNLHLHIKYDLDKQFERKDSDIYTNLNVCLLDSLLGTKIEIITLYGNVSVNLTKGIESGKILRLTGKGLPVYNTNIFGDHYIKINIVIPKELIESEIKILSQLKGDKWIIGKLN